MVRLGFSFLTPMSRRVSNPRSRVVPDWDLSDAVLTELYKWLTHKINNSCLSYAYFNSSKKHSTEKIYLPCLPGRTTAILTSYGVLILAKKLPLLNHSAILRDTLTRRNHRSWRRKRVAATWNQDHPLKTNSYLVKIFASALQHIFCAIPGKESIFALH